MAADGEVDGRLWYGARARAVNKQRWTGRRSTSYLSSCYCHGSTARPCSDWTGSSLHRGGLLEWLVKGGEHKVHGVICAPHDVVHRHSIGASRLSRPRTQTSGAGATAFFIFPSQAGFAFQKRMNSPPRTRPQGSSLSAAVNSSPWAISPRLEHQKTSRIQPHARPLSPNPRESESTMALASTIYQTLFKRNSIL